MSDRNENEYAAHLEELGYRYEPLPVFNLSMNRVLFLIGFCATGIFVGAFLSTMVFWLLSQRFQLLVDHNALDYVKEYLSYGVPFITFPVIIVLLIKKFLSDCDVWPTITKENLYNKISERPWSIYFSLAYLLILSV
jgi:hypothetical protein